MTPEEATDHLFSLLFKAAINGNVSDAKAALDAGAEVNTGNALKQTPLHYACWKGHTEVARLLIDKGAEVNARDNQRYTPLHWATLSGKTDLARLLIDKGAEVSARDNSSNTPRHYALKDGRRELAELLATAERWNEHLKPLMGPDNKVDATQLVDRTGLPTEPLTKLLPNDLFGQLARPDFYRQGMDGLVEVFPYLPEVVQLSIDLTPWRRLKAQEANEKADKEGRWLKRYSRRTRASSSEVTP